MPHSPILPKRNAKFIWGPNEQQKFEELKHKLVNLTPLGVPKSQGEIVIITDASDVGGGSSMYQ